MERKFRTVGHVFGAIWKIGLAIYLLCSYPLGLVQLLLSIVVLASGLISLYKAASSAILILDEETKDNPEARKTISCILNFIGTGF